MAAHALATPDAVALRACGADLSYRELDRLAMGWAARLRADGVRPGDIVTVRLEREPRLVAVLLGVLKCGAAYLAVDPAWPEARVTQALALTAGPLVVDRARPPGARPEREIRVGALPDAEPWETATALSRPAYTAAVFHTSGSTGLPKAVLSPHRAAVHVLHEAPYADFGPGTAMLQAAPMPWDGMSLELWGPLLNGGTCVLADHDTDLAKRLRRHILRDALTTVWLTSAVFNALVDDDIACFTGLRQILTGGERLSPDHVARFTAAHPAIALVNGYGPCEATVFVATHHVEARSARERGEVPLGRALPGVAVEIRPGPRSADGAGEIVVGGAGLAHGYLGDPRSTARAFVPAPGGERRYLTGDLGVFDEAGLLAYRGRIDRQVKIRGQRVEPQELERLVREVLPVAQVVVTPVRMVSGEAVGLAAHVRPGAEPPDEAEWWKRLEAAAAELPAYLRPQRLVVHDALPLLPNGKVDVTALTESVRRPAGTADEPDGAAARGGEVVRAAAELGIVLGSGDDLFAAGADSLAVIRLLSRLHAGGPRLLDPADVYRVRTPAALARLMDERRAAPTVPDEPVRPAGAVPRAVYEMWLHEQMNPGDEGSLVVCAFALTGAPDPDLLHRALVAVARRHPALGSMLRFDGAGVTRAALGPDALADALRPRPLPAAVRVEADRLVIDPGALDVFDLEGEPPWRCHTGPGPGGGTLLLLVLHHAAVDGWSERIALRDLGSAYRGGELAAAPAVMPGPPAQEGAQEHWREALRAAAVPAVPVEEAEPAAGGRRSPRLFVGATALRELLGADGPSGPAAVQALLLGRLGRALGALTGQREDVIVGVAYSGRDDGNDQEVGLLVDMLPIALPTGADTDPGSRDSGEYAVGGPDSVGAYPRCDSDGPARDPGGVRGIERAWLAAVRYRSGISLSSLSRALRDRGGSGRSPFPVAFALQSGPPPGLDLGPRPAARRLAVRLTGQPFDVFVEARPDAHGGVIVDFHHDATRVDGRWTRRLAEAFRAELPASPDTTLEVSDDVVA